MKKYFVFVFLISSLFLNACQQNNSDKNLSADLVKDGKKPKMTFKETKHDFGTITDGEVVSHTFEFVNDGDGDLLITEAVTSCGCTVPEYPKHPVKPGEKAKVEVKFNSAGKKGLEKKTVTLVANTVPPYNEIEISANVNPSPGQ
ncbi:MAG: DUF1573 domain-containing protein [Sphingobacteriales bacterium]|nr:MAG: DUF1573 domain-containing protein [Sphingobacteriales bacterium]